jgi:tricarballylate dehydrogenase
LATQPEQLAYSIVDSKTIRGFLPPVFKPYQSDTLEGLAKVLDLDPRAFMQTITEFNRGAAGKSNVRMEMLDGSCTRGVTAPKTNWALPIDTAPFYGFPLRTGVTFTYMGVAVDEVARVLDQSGWAFENVYAAWKHPYERLSGGYRHDDRRHIRSDCGKGGRKACQLLICINRPIETML